MTQKQNIINKIRSSPLFKHWERDYSIFFWSMTSDAHTAVNSPKLGEGSLTLALFIYQNGIGEYYRLLQDNGNFFTIIGNKLKTSRAFSNYIFKQYYHFGDKINSMNEQIKTKKSFGPEFVRQYSKNWQGIVTYQLIVHRAIDYLVQFPECNDLVRQFTKARIRFENLFGYYQKMESRLFQTIAARRRFGNPKILELLTPDELINFMETGLIPPNVELRKGVSVISSVPNYKIFYDKDALDLKKEVDNNLRKTAEKLAQDKSLTGIVVYGQGIIRGIAQVINDYTRLSGLKRGRIIVAPSTLPKFGRFYKKAKAIITDEGGLLSHAAIFCREFKIPGVVGTKIATQLIKDGDRVEVNATKGIVRKI